jgi:IS4 transposase
MRALLKKKNGHYSETIEGRDGNRKKARLKIKVCVASKDYEEEKTGKKHRKKLLFAISGVRRTWREIRELYRKRFGIETTYRQMNEARIKTCSRDPRIRLLFAGIALVLRNVWVWLHFRFAKNKYSEEPELFLELLRFREMLLWITEVVQKALGADKTIGIDHETYQRVTSRY